MVHAASLTEASGQGAADVAWLESLVLVERDEVVYAGG